ncbi:MAG: exo-alpha-sialidase, partial [Ignavibacteriae bacterium]|nr:exo-alpha-sialidase [Ignavibacteriota bacterium]
MKRSTALAAIVLLALGVVASFAQDDPRFDTPPIAFPQVNPQPQGATINVITSVDGWDNFDLGTTNAEPHMVTNPLNPLWFFNAFNTNSTFRTTDGLSWTASSPNFGVSPQGDPVTAYDSLGNLYYETMYGGPVGCRVIRSTDNGATWTAAVTAISGVDKNWIAADQTMGPFANYVYTTMTRSGGGNFARSTDLGATWTNTFAPTTQVLPGMMVAVGPNVFGDSDISGGCVYVVTHSGTNAAGIYTFYLSTDGGLTFNQKSTNQFSNLIGTQLSGRSTVQGMRCRPYPMIAADNSFGSYRGRLYLVYASNNPAGDGNKSDIFLRYSTDQGTTWSAAAVVNDDPSSQNNFQFHPAIWCDKETGRLYIKFYDTRRVPTSDSMDVYATYTDDGGVTFAPNQRLTNRTFKINISGAAGPTYRGDYDAITSNRYAALAVWTDFRNAPSPNYLGMTAYFPDFAMLVSPTADTLGFSDSVDAVLKVPAVKLYTHSVKFTASVSPAANFSFSFPQGDSLTSYPDSLIMRIKTTGVAQGNYTVTVTGAGPNGTPVHRRTVNIRVETITNAVAVIVPNGGENWEVASSQNIQWNRSGSVDAVKIDYSVNNGSSWTNIVSSVPATPGTYAWTVPNTPTTQGRVRVTWASDTTITDLSDGPFTISTAGGADSVLVILHDSTLGTSNNMLKRKADRDSLFAYLSSMVPNYDVAYKDTSGSTLPNLENYKKIIAVETSFDDAVVRWFGGASRQALKDWLNAGTPAGKRSLIMFGADLGYNYSRPLSGSYDTVLADQMLKFTYQADNGNALGSITGVTVNPGLVIPYTTTPPGGGFWPDGCLPGSGSNVLYKYTGRPETDSVAGIGYNAPGYTSAVMFQDPRYFVGGFETVLRSVLQYSGVITDVRPTPQEIATEFILQQNYPNPFNPTTTLRYSLPTEARVTLSIFNTLGQRVATLKNDVQNVGSHELVWNAQND